MQIIQDSRIRENRTGKATQGILIALFDQGLLPVQLLAYLGLIKVQQHIICNDSGSSSIKAVADAVPFSGEVEVDESYFRGRRKDERGLGSADNIHVFGLLKGEWWQGLDRNDPIGQNSHPHDNSGAKNRQDRVVYLGD